MSGRIHYKHGVYHKPSGKYVAWFEYASQAINWIQTKGNSQAYTIIQKNRTK